ncbi:MAG: 30S ribosome-binding factor RbfA [Brevinema sp.]
MIRKNFGTNTASRRSERYEKNIQKEIAMVIMQELKDPGINALTSVLDVRMSKDYEVAYVKVRIFGSDKKDIVKTLDALRRSAGYISSHVGSNLGLRRSPEIRFEPVKDEEYNTVWLNKDVHFNQEDSE